MLVESYLGSGGPVQHVLAFAIHRVKNECIRRNIRFIVLILEIIKGIEIRPFSLVVETDSLLAVLQRLVRTVVVSLVYPQFQVRFDVIYHMYMVVLGCAHRLWSSKED